MLSLLRIRDWEWSLSLNYAYNKNKIKKISNALREQNEKNQAKGGVTPLPIYEEGQSLTALKVVSSAGIDPITGNEVFIKRDGALRSFTILMTRSYMAIPRHLVWVQSVLTLPISSSQWECLCVILSAELSTTRR